ncbi:hypothetical protein BDP27DRAFT_1370452 [Rhodocollybia butyracea]|uniref:Uncharacterized protein n=1 Tax=Rhodocollybia butyracea TaxID=206335 RepID=A0A9P5PD48_9AGAR|nr:hypothetical protein BDP27DRAFT_1370452 [Rhodocollybia butyracea]
MTPSCAGNAYPLRVPANLNSEELFAWENNLRFGFGPSVVTPERAKELKAMLALVNKEIETQRTKLLSLLSPMRKLPIETLLHIFHHVCEQNLLQCYPWEEEKNPPTNITSPVITYLPTMAISSFVGKPSSGDAHYVLGGYNDVCWLH